MNLKILVTSCLALFLVGFGTSAMALVFVDDGTAVENMQGQVQPQAAETPSNTTSTTINQAPAVQDTTPEPTSSPAPTAPVTPTAPTTPPPAVLACGNGGPCTAAEVATHNSQSNCWGIYAGKVYNLTSYAPKHDGGSAAFNSSSCGTDMTKYLNGSSGSGGVKSHRHSQKAYNILSSYYIAELKL